MRGNAIDGAAGSGTTWTRRFVWDATADVGEVKIADVALSVEAEMPLGGVQLWENDPYWAECNVGATKPEDYGYYFWWGDTATPRGPAGNEVRQKRFRRASRRSTERHFIQQLCLSSHFLDNFL